MPRAKRGFKARRRRNKVLKSAKGYQGARSRAYRTAVEAVDKAGQYAYVGRKLRKRDFRRLWATRIGAAAKLNDISYSQLIGKLTAKNVGLNRKMLSEIAARYPKDFETIVNMAKAN